MDEELELIVTVLIPAVLTVAVISGSCMAGCAIGRLICKGLDWCLGR